jgi:hypothetical protein
MHRDKKLLVMGMLISPRLSLRTRMSPVSGSNVFPNYPRDVAGDTASTVWKLANGLIVKGGDYETYNSSRAGGLRVPPIRQGKFAVASA